MFQKYRPNLKSLGLCNHELPRNLFSLSNMLLKDFAGLVPVGGWAAVASLMSEAEGMVVSPAQADTLLLSSPC